MIIKEKLFWLEVFSMKLFSFSFLLSLLFLLPVNAQNISLAGDMPESACECYDSAFLHGSYNYTPNNSPQTETIRFKCGLKGWQQAFDEGHWEGQKDYKFSNGDYSQGTGNGICPYPNY